MSIKYYMQSSLWRQSSPVYGGKDLWKGRFWACSGKEKELWTVQVMMIYMNCHEWNAVTVKETDY